VADAELLSTSHFDTSAAGCTSMSRVQLICISPPANHGAFFVSSPIQSDQSAHIDAWRAHQGCLWCVAGSLEGFGFWYHLQDHPDGPSKTYSVCPKYEALGVFKCVPLAAGSAGPLEICSTLTSVVTKANVAALESSCRCLVHPYDRPGWQLISCLMSCVK
jgi:serine protease inhibitor ecotin